MVRVPWNKGISDVKLTCQACGVEFISKKRDKRKYCSRECSLHRKQSPEEVEKRAEKLRGHKMPSHVNKMLQEFRKRPH